MKISNPYCTGPVEIPPDTIQKERTQASKKATARYPNKSAGITTTNGEAGKMKRAAYTPGGPSGS